MRRALQLLLMIASAMLLTLPAGTQSATTSTQPVASPAIQPTPLLSGDPATRQRVLFDAAQHAEMAFRKGEYATARSRYEELAELAPHDPDVLFNLAATHARLGERGPAIWRFMQAQELRPRDPELREQLKALDYELPTISPVPLVDGLYYMLSTNEWAWLAAVATGLGLLALALALWLVPGSPWRARLRGLGWWPLGLGLLAWPFAIAHYYQEHSIARGVVVAERAVARTGPDAATIETFALPPGTLVRVDGRAAEGWLKISFAGGRKGYVPQDDVRYL